MYLIQIDHVVYGPKGADRVTGGWTLVEALREVRGVRNARVLRNDRALTVVVTNAGSDAGPLTYAPTGKLVHRRPAVGPRRTAWRLRKAAA